MPDSNEREDLKLLVANSYEVITTTVQFACRSYHHYPPPDEVEELRGQIIVLLLEDDCRRLKTYDPEKSSFKTWLQHVTNHHVSHYFQQQHPVEPIEDLPPDLFSFPPTQEKELLMKEESHLLHEAVSKLTAHDQRMAGLIFDEVSYEEIATEMNISAQSVRQEWYRIGKKLKRIMLCKDSK